MDSGSEYENSKPFLIPQDVGCQNIAKAEPVIRSDCSSNPLLVVEGEVEVICNSSQAFFTVDEEEKSCACLENNEIGDVNSDTSVSVNNKSACLSGDSFKSFQIVAFNEEDTTQPCKGDADFKESTISNFEEAIQSPVLEACHNQNNLLYNGNENIEKENANTLLTWRNTCKSLAEEDQSCISGTNGGLKEDSDNLPEYNKNDNTNAVSGNSPLEKFNVDLVEGAEVDESQNRKMIEICESVLHAKCHTCNEVNEIVKDDLESLSKINNRENIDAVLGTNTLSEFSSVDLEVEGADIGAFENGDENGEATEGKHIFMQNKKSKRKTSLEDMACFLPASDNGSGSVSGLPALQEVPVETGEEKEKALFTADSVLFEYISGAWKERGKGELKVNLSTVDAGKARLVMSAGEAKARMQEKLEKEKERESSGCNGTTTNDEDSKSSEDNEL